MSEIHSVSSAQWNLQDLSTAQRMQALAVLEDGGVLVLPHLPFAELDTVRWLLDPKWADPRRKNISFDSTSQSLRGVHADAAVCEAVRTLMGGFQNLALVLIAALAPRYAAQMRTAPVSLRLHEVQGRQSSWRADDSRLHIDAFPSRPSHGERILRVFRNINPDGKARIWRVGEPFIDVARRFGGQVPRYRRAHAIVLNMLGMTRSVRSPYDHTMLHLHDRMKADLDYQRTCPQSSVPFAPHTTWVCFSDQTSHAAMSGQFLLEQTLHPTVAVMQNPAKAPIAVLDSMFHRSMR